MQAARIPIRRPILHHPGAAAALHTRDGPTGAFGPWYSSRHGPVPPPGTADLRKSYTGLEGYGSRVHACNMGGRSEIRPHGSTPSTGRVLDDHPDPSRPAPGGMARGPSEAAMRGMAAQCMGIRPREENARIREGGRGGRRSRPPPPPRSRASLQCPYPTGPCSTLGGYDGARASPPGGGRGPGRGLPRRTAAGRVSGGRKGTHGRAARPQILGQGDAPAGADPGSGRDDHGQAACIKSAPVVTTWTGVIHVHNVRQGVVPYSSAAGGTSL
ncbi:hypothetical protein IBTHAUMO2_60002 [Nitrosopumilaceae archaeon]|nr:hypothetical protein IBTHAUMO2_60002 [Nitrosopumilaceae archaeon]